MEIPLGAFVCVTGASGSGKSSLVSDILVEALRRDLNGGNGEPGEHDRIEGLEHLDKMIAIDQSPDRSYAPIEPRDLHQGLRRNSQAVHPASRGEAAGLQAGAIQFQRDGGPVRGVQRQRLEQTGNGFSGRRLDHLQRLSGTPVQSRVVADQVQGKVNCRRAGNGCAAGARTL